MFPMRTVVMGAFVPTGIVEVGMGAMLPIIAPSVVSLGGSLQVAALIAALLPVGKILADLPAGALAARVGDRMAMILAGVVAALSFVLAGFAPSVITLGVAMLAVGAASAVFGLARHSYLTEITPPLRRARVLSTLAGVHRIGQFLGPFVGALVVAGGNVSNAYLLGAGTAVIATFVLVLIREEPRQARREARRAPRDKQRTVAPAAPTLTLRQVLAEHHRKFTTVGIAVVLVGSVRGARLTVLPLWGEYLGLEASTTSLIFGLAGAVDMVLFYPAGKIMDHLGRLWIGIPSMIIMALSMFLLPFTQSVWSMSVVAAIMGFGNGISTGVLMTIGSDLAPEHGRAQFLAMWRVLQDGGMSLGPLAVTVGAALGSLAAGIFATGFLGVAATGALGHWVPKWSVHANRRTRRAAGIDPKPPRSTKPRAS